jgi:hypothetical protein
MPFLPKRHFQTKSTGQNNVCCNDEQIGALNTSFCNEEQIGALVCLQKYATFSDGC